MTASTIAIYVGVGLYFAAMLTVGYLVRNKVKTSECYLVAGRSFSLAMNAPALTACFLGGSLVLSLTGLTYGMGAWNDEAMWGGAVSLGGVFCLLIAGFFICPGCGG